MKISIDTKHDRPEDIRKVIELLAHLSGDRPRTNFETKPRSLFEDTSQETASAFASMFGAADSRQDVQESQEEPEDKIEIIPY
jgi:hypothetical protein